MHHDVQVHAVAKCVQERQTDRPVSHAVLVHEIEALKRKGQLPSVSKRDRVLRRAGENTQRLDFAKSFKPRVRVLAS